MFELEIKGKQDTKKDTRKKTIEDDDDQEDIYNSDASLLLRRSLDIASSLVEDVEINVTDKGLFVQVMDSMHACIADIFLSKKIFDKFRCDRTIKLGVKLKDLMKILKSLSFQGDYAFKMYCCDDGEVMVLTYDCERYNLNFDIPLTSLNATKYEFPSQEYDAELEMGTKDFLLVPKLVGSAQSKACLKLKEMEDVNINITNDVKKEIAMKYITCTGKAAAMCDNMRIGLSETTPVFFDFGLGEQGYIRFYIAPKVVDQDDN